MSDLIRPFKINTAPEALADLQSRLAATRWPDPETPDDWSQGIPLQYVQELTHYWATQYDWGRCEAALNDYDQYLTEIDGLDIHFLHLRSPHADALPMVLTHGWPGSIIEFNKVLRPLTHPTEHGGNAADAFHLVVPTLPGFGYSGKPTAPGWSTTKIAQAWGQLMARLGYDKYVAQGGDWGSIVTSLIGKHDADHVMAIHMNMPVVPPDPATMDSMTPQEQAAIKAAQFYQESDSGYSKQQATRPQTLGYGLVDSPVGQMAWIVEKFYQWTDCDGHPENVLTRDELLDNVMMYWLTASGASSARIYWESMGAGAGSDQVTVPTGCSQFPKEIFKTSKRWAQQLYPNIIHWNELDKGGHFAAFEQPELFLGEVRTCFRQLR